MSAMGFPYGLGDQKASGIYHNQKASGAWMEMGITLEACLLYGNGNLWIFCKLDQAIKDLRLAGIWKLSTNVWYERQAMLRDGKWDRRGFLLHEAL